MQPPRAPAPMPAGLSFDVSDLLILQAWSDFHALRMTIELDVCAGGDEYEEIIGLYDKDCAFRRWTVWRSADAIVVQPAMGRKRLFDAMTDVLDMLIPAKHRHRPAHMFRPKHRHRPSGVVTPPMP